MKKKLIAGNWKMNGSSVNNEALVKAIAAGMVKDDCLVAICAPAVYLGQLQSLVAGSGIDTGSQDVSQHESGAYTGEVSAGMLRDFGVRYCLAGHSERRQYHGETDTVVALKAQRALLPASLQLCVLVKHWRSGKRGLPKMWSSANSQR